jgi:hypothetical protein
VQVTGNATTGAPTISAQGSDTNVGLQIATKGTGSLLLQPAGVNTLRLDSASGRVNQFQMYTIGTGTGGASGNIVMLGTDTNIDLNLFSKGTGAINLNSGNGLQFKVNNTYGAGGTAVNYFSVYGRQTGSAPILAAEGSDSSIAPIFAAKAGNILFRTADITGGNQFVISHTASAVNYVQVTGGATTVRPEISVQGSDTNINLAITAKGTGVVNISNATRLSFGSANYVQVAGASAGSAPAISSLGSDTNIDLTLTPKGAGKVVLTNGLQGGTF